MLEDLGFQIEDDLLGDIFGLVAHPFQLADGGEDP